MVRKVPFNIYSIQDLEEWRNSFTYPVSSRLSELVNERVCSLLVDRYGRLRDGLKTSFRIASKALYIETYNLLMKTIIACTMRQDRACEFVLTNHLVPEDVRLADRNTTYELYRGSEDVLFPDLRLEYDDRPFRSIPYWKKLGKHAMEAMKWNRRPRPGNCNRTMIMGPNACTLKYAKLREEKSPYLLYPELIFGMSRIEGKRSSMEADVSALASDLGEEMSSLFTEVTGTPISRRILASYSSAIEGLFKRIPSDLTQARPFCRGMPSDVKLYTGTAKYFVRVMGEAVREIGGEVTGFPHEGGLSGLSMPYLSFTEFATCDQFVCFDEKEAEDYGKYRLINKVNFPVVQGLGESILNMDPSRLHRGATIDLKDVSSIMYVNLAYWYDSYTYGTRSDLQGLDLQLRILDFLVSLGKRIIFKLRPKTAYLSKQYDHFGYFKGSVDYTAIPFPDVLDQADLFVLEGVGSTALYEAMTLTSKPIILLKQSVPKCTALFEEMLRKRCYVVDLHEDDRNRLCFEEESLKRAFGLH